MCREFAEASAVGMKAACNKPGLFDLLNDVEGRLNLCKRSLMDFLDAKRRQFPRFYFMSEADLLDVFQTDQLHRK